MLPQMTAWGTGLGVGHGMPCPPRITATACPNESPDHARGQANDTLLPTDPRRFCSLHSLSVYSPRPSRAPPVRPHPRHACPQRSVVGDVCATLAAGAVMGRYAIETTPTDWQRTFLRVIAIVIYKSEGPGHTARTLANGRMTAASKTPGVLDSARYS